MNMLRSIGGTIQAAALAAALCGGMLVLVTGCPTAGGGGGGDGDGNGNGVDECQDNADCADDLFCNGLGTCEDGQCVPRDPCEENEVCDEQADECIPPGPPATYVGTAKCLECHGEGGPGADMSAFANSGHPFKLNKIENDQVPTYPAFAPGIDGALELMDDDDAASDDGATADPNVGGTDNTLGTPQSYADISYVIGGYGWKSRWIDADGYIVTGSMVQFNLEDESWSAYHNNETDKPYTCGNCHTTGWRAYTSEEGDDRNLNRQDDLPGMAGTFAAAGVHCEACHGAGSDHAAAPTKDNITKVAVARTTADFLAEDMAYGKPVACSECHTRQGEMDYPNYTPASGKIQASGGLIKHHEQWDEMMGVDPDNEAAGPTGPHSALACTDCHDPHTTTIYQDVSGDAPGMTKPNCTGCHHTKTISETSGMADLVCVDCHMPRLAKSAIGHAAEGTGPATGDIRSHIFRIDLTKEDQFTADGGFAYPWITPEFACKTCHNGVTAADFPVEFLSTQTIHPE